MNIFFRSLLFCFLLLSYTTEAQVKQQSIPRVDQMADMPKSFKIIDYNKLAHNFDEVVYDIIHNLIKIMGQLIVINNLKRLWHICHLIYTRNGLLLYLCFSCVA